MKDSNTCNRHNFHDHCGSKCRELVQHARSRGSHAFTLHTLTSTQLQPRGVKCHLSYYIIYNQYFNIPEVGGANQSTQKKPQTACPIIGIT